MCKRIICATLLILAFSLSFSVSAEGEHSFSLSDVSCEKNRIFETTLYASDEVAVFVATFTYNENLLSFRGASAVDKNAEISINSAIEGKVTVAYLCEEGAKGNLLTLSFKSTDADAYIDIDIEQAIDKNCNPLSTANCKGADVTIIGKAVQATKHQETQPSQGFAEESHPHSEDAVNKIEVVPKNTFDPTLLICISGGCVALLGVTLAAFLIGRNTANKNKTKNKKV